MHAQYWRIHVELGVYPRNLEVVSSVTILFSWQICLLALIICGVWSILALCYKGCSVDSSVWNGKYGALWTPNIAELCVLYTNEGPNYLHIQRQLETIGLNPSKDCSDFLLPVSNISEKYKQFLCAVLKETSQQFDGDLLLFEFIWFEFPFSLKGLKLFLNFLPGVCLFSRFQN